MFGFSVLEDRLLGPDGGAALAETLAALRSFRGEVAAAVEAGLPAADYATAQLLLAALTAGERILLDTTHLKGVQ